MAELKTKLNDGNVIDFINGIEDNVKRQDCFRINEIMKGLTGAEPKMWGESIVGYGNYHYKYASGREGEWFLTGFSPRKQNLTLYLMSGFDKTTELTSKLGKHKTSKSCLYIKKMDDIDEEVLKELINKSIKHLKSH